MPTSEAGRFMLACVTLVCALVINFSAVANADDAESPVGTFVSVENPKFYIQIDSSKRVSTNVAVYNGSTWIGNWIPTSGLRSRGNGDFYFPAYVDLNVGPNQSIRCRYSGKIDVFQVNASEIDATVTLPSQFIGADGKCGFSGELTSTNAFRR